MATHLRLGGVRRTGSMPVDLTPGAATPHDGEAILHHLVDFLDAFMWQADPRTLEITFVTDGVNEILGHPIEAWLGDPKHWSQSIHVEDRERVIDTLRATGRDGVDRDVEFRARAADGEIHTLRHAIRLIAPPSGENELWIITTDETVHVRTEDELRKTRDRYRALSVETAEFKRRSLEDPLTRLPNRVLFHDRLGSTLRAAVRSGEPFTVLLLDLDRFKELNDTCGHQAGDAALKEFALRFRICLRGQDTPARIGGDEFAAVLPKTDEAGAIRVAERIVSTMHDPLQSVDCERVLGASVGIAIYPNHGSDAEDLLARADAAMYRAKARGSGYALADEAAAVTKGRATRLPWRRFARRSVIAGAAALAILVGGMTPIALRQDTAADTTTQLVRAAAVLEHVDPNEVGAAVGDVEQTLAQIPWKEVGTHDVVSALDRLEMMLYGLKTDATSALGVRVEHLIARVHQAAEIARLSQAIDDPRTPKAQPNRRPVPSNSEAPELPTSVPTPNADPSVPAPKLP